ncbi:SDR family NAD(P)-dependent oxidoreductase [Modestobacter sp. Leaf380]|uniref:SDR family NAD(P)-dependent oxidoreductase n=1 Tax=Modestobacter sp. Leaf380 TaxID=1736356 RepID=UPI0006FFD383|nr:3-oxoacyl-ACP reductase family protein [Modestobacter sp. Leaf380]KQS68264.1 2-deoxy-D-gluconate 3-dehydrogenase [Modestobacter sp. Leaf380]
MSNKVAVVTGAGRGLGLAIADDLAARGVRVVLAGRSSEHLESAAAGITAAGGTAVAVPTDVTDADSVTHLFATANEAFGRVDVLVNNAGITTQVNVVDLDETEWDRVFDTNVRGMFLCTRAAGRLFAEARSGRVVNVASVFGLLGRPGFSAYCASKGAVINFTRSVASEWSRFGAQVNAVAPGYISTDINAAMRADEALMARVLQRIPARRMGEPAELANVVGYLALDAPDFLTGQTVVLDGGESSV